MAGNEFFLQRAKDVVGVTPDNTSGPFQASFAGCFSVAGDSWGQFVIPGAKINEIPKVQLAAIAEGLAKNEGPSKVEKSETEKFMKIVDGSEGDVVYAVYKGLGEAYKQWGMTAATAPISKDNKALIVGCYEDGMEGRSCTNRVVLVANYIANSYK